MNGVVPCDLDLLGSRFALLVTAVFDYLRVTCYIIDVYRVYYSSACKAPDGIH